MGIMLNEDCCHFLDSRSNIIENVDVDYLNAFIDQYANTGVSDFIMNISSTLSYVPSKTIEFAGDKYNVKEELGVPVDYTKDAFTRAVYHLWYEKGIDMYQVWIDRCRYNKIHPWLSFRMNNAEFLYGNEPHAHLSQYYYKHFYDYARVNYRTKFSGHDQCRDYGIEEFREYMLAYIEEMINRYDVFGIELDFLREHVCLKIGDEYEGRKILTGFVGRVKKIITDAEKKYKHPIKLLVRCPIEPRLAFEWGFDVVAWARQGLVDVIVPSPNWITTDNDAPLVLWNTILEPYNVEVVGCIERNINSNPEYFNTLVQREFGFYLQPNTLESFCGSVVATLSQIPGKLYLFNYMDAPETDTKPKEITCPIRDYSAVLNCVVDFEKTIRMPRKHIVSYNDTPLPWMKCNAVFPMEFGSKKALKAIRINTGIIPEDMACILELGMKSIKDVEVFCNGVKLNFVSQKACTKPILTDNEVYCFGIPSNARKSQYQVIEICALETMIDYAAIIVC